MTDKPDELDELDKLCEIKRLLSIGVSKTAVAERFGKSVSWVYSRLGARVCQSEHVKHEGPSASASANAIKDPLLREEVTTVQALEAQGMTYTEIAKAVGRSVGWVQSRLGRGKAMPKGVGSERQFQTARVVPFLVSLGHEILGQHVRRRRHWQEVDIASRFGGEEYVVEVKASLSHHQLQDGIGQLVLHRFGAGSLRLRLMLAVPSEESSGRVTTSMCKYLREKEGIEVLLVPVTRDVK